MARIIIVGDGPGGLSAALFLAKNGQDVTMFGLDSSAMDYAYLYNYLGIPEISGTELQRIGHQQAANFGAVFHHQRVTAVVAAEPGFVVTTDDDERHAADFVILTEGKDAELARSLGLAAEDGTIRVDRSGRTDIPRAYVVGRSARPARSQAIISAGDGAAAALDILAAVAGKDVQDWDTPPKED